jgi:hypothetical protein
MLYPMIANAVFTTCLIVVIMDGLRYRGKYAPGAGAMHSVLIAIFGIGALLSWAAVTVIFWVRHLGYATL